MGYGDSLLICVTHPAISDTSTFRTERSTLWPQFSSLRPSLHGDAAVDDEAGAGHEGRVVRGEKDDALGDVGHCPHAADRQPRQGLLARLIEVVAAEIAGP